MSTETIKDPDTLLGEALCLMRDAYRTHVREIAGDIIRESRDNPDEDREWVLQYIHETIDGDGWVIYTAKAQAVVLCSDNDGASIESFGSDGIVEHGAINWSMLAYGALEADVMEALDREGFDVNAEFPGRVEAEETT